MLDGDLVGTLPVIALQTLDDVCGDLRRGGIASVTGYTTERGADGVVVVAVSEGGICHSPRYFHRVDARAEGLADVRCDFYDEVVVLDVRGGSGIRACIVEDFDTQTLEA